MKMIDIKNLTFEYFRRDAEGNLEEMIQALHDVNLDVRTGDFIAIVGRNGSGKSTLAKHINALLLPGEGAVLVDGMDTEDEELRLQIRETAGMVFQNPDNQIVANLVEEDVAFGPENLGISTESIWNRVEEALTITDMEKYRRQSPNQLSGGQKQRVAIAGVLAMEPKCIIFDEATSMLDPKGRKQILEVAKKLQAERNITVIWITHHMDEVVMADKVFVMQEGKILCEGEPQEVFKQQELLQQCGLHLPMMDKYRNFLVLQGIVSEEESRTWKDSVELSRWLCNRYGTMQGYSSENHNKVAVVERSSDVNDLSDGLLLNHVSYIYNKGFTNECAGLDNVTLRIGKGEFVAVIGHTGSGKSTLMQHFNGLYAPTEGNVYFDGEDIWEKGYSIRELRQKVGLVFQYPEYQLFEETVEKDVCFGPMNMNITKVEAQKRAYEAIRQVGLPDTIYDASPLQLSGGQKRRVAIAGVLAMQPEYLILDEPTAGLDAASARELLMMLKELQQEKGITIVMVSHSMEEVAEFADRIVVMQEGGIVLDGTVWQVFAEKDLLESMNLDIPVGISVLQELNRVGIPVDVTQYRYLDICGELMKLKA